MTYCLSENKLLRAIKGQGYKNIGDFTRAYGINRTTLAHYFEGRGPLMAPFEKICTALNFAPTELLEIQLPEAIAGVDEIHPLVTTLAEANPLVAIALFGSRASGKNQKHSDWDLGVTAGKVLLTAEVFLKIKALADDLSEDLGHGVDVVNFDAAPNWFFLEMKKPPLYLAGNQQAWTYFEGILHGLSKA